MKESEFEDLFIRLLLATTQVEPDETESKREKNKFYLSRYGLPIETLEIEMYEDESIEDYGYVLKYFIYRQGEIGNKDVHKVIKLHKHKDKEIYIIEYIDEQETWNKFFAKSLNEAMIVVRAYELGTINDMTKESLYINSVEGRDL